MASTSRPTGNSRISTASSALYSDNQSLIAVTNPKNPFFSLFPPRFLTLTFSWYFQEIRKSINIFKNIAVDLEKNEKTDKVKKLEEGVLELLETYDDCTRFSDAIKSMGESYQPADQVIFSLFVGFFLMKIVMFFCLCLVCEKCSLLILGRCWRMRWRSWRRHRLLFRLAIPCTGISKKLFGYGFWCLIAFSRNQVMDCESLV